MIYLGSFKATDTVFYAANFHNDTGTLEDPTSPEAQIRNAAGTWSALTTPAKQNSKTGHYGGTIDTTGFSVGQHVIRMAGTVATAKTVATEFCFTIVANIESDTYAIVNNGTYGNAQLVRSTTPANTLDVSATGEAGLDFANVKDATGAHTLTNITVPTVTTLTNAPSDSSGVTALLTRIASALTITSGKVDVNDKTGFSLSSAGVQAIWDALTSALTTVGSVGKRIADYLDAAVSSRSTYAGGAVASVTAAVTVGTNNDKTGYSISGTKNTLDALNDITAASVWAVTTRLLTAGTNIVLAKGTGITGFNDLSASGVANAVWDEAIAGHLGAGTTGNKLNAAASAGDPWTAALPGSYGAGSAGYMLGTNLDATISSRLATSGYTAPDNVGISMIFTESQSHPTLSEIEASVVLAKEATVTAVKSKTDNLPADPASNTQVSTRLATSGYTAPDNTSITAIKAKTDTIVWTNITDLLDEALGKWSINKITNVLTIYRQDGITVLKQFNLTDSASVSERTPV